MKEEKCHVPFQYRAALVIVLRVALHGTGDLKDEPEVESKSGSTRAHKSVKSVIQPKHRAPSRHVISKGCVQGESCSNPPINSHSPQMDDPGEFS